MENPNPAIADLVAEVEAYDADLALRLREQMTRPCALWPDGVMEVVAEKVSGSVWDPGSRTFKGLDRRIRWAAAVWADRYGPLNEAQRAYVSRLLIAGINKGAEEAGDDRKKLYSYIHKRIEYLVNHEVTDAGFKKRATSLVSVEKQLQEALA